MQDVMAVTPEAAGSSPVDPANYFQFKYFHGQLNARTPGEIAGGRELSISPLEIFQEKRHSLFEPAVRSAATAASCVAYRGTWRGTHDARSVARGVAI
jgi:hypothetical protein